MTTEKDSLTFLDRTTLLVTGTIFPHRLIHMMTRQDMTRQETIDNQSNAVKDKSGNQQEGSATRKLWRDHFEEILNIPKPNDSVIYIELDPVMDEISAAFITKIEKQHKRKMKHGLGGDKDDIIVDLMKADMSTAEKLFLRLFWTFWNKRKYQRHGSRG